MLLDNIKTKLSEHARRIVDARRPDESRQDFAKRIGVGDGTLGRILSGEGNPSLSTIVALAEAGRMQPWQLIAPAADRLNEQPATYHVNNDQLMSAIAAAEMLIAEAGNPPLAPYARAFIINTVMRLQTTDVGMESASMIVAEYLATQSKERSNDGTVGSTSRRTGANHKK